MNALPLIRWSEQDLPQVAGWRSSSGLAPPARVVVADDRMSADAAFRLASEGTALLWRGDFQNARQLLQAMARRIDRPARRPPKAKTQKAPDTPASGSASDSASGSASNSNPVSATAAVPASLPEPAAAAMIDLFNRHRQAQSQRARTLGMLLIPLCADYTIALRRAPDLRDACAEAYGPSGAPASSDAPAARGAGAAVATVASLREIQGLIGAHEWRKKGIEVPALGERIHPHYGVFAPVRSEYLDLVAAAPLPATQVAFDIGTGTGVLAAILAQRGMRQVTATDLDARALACARENLQRLGLADRVEVRCADLFPDGRAGLIVCNPPWIPARPSSPLEHAVYDPDSRMLRGFLAGLTAHLSPGGEGWLILSDLAEHLGLRSRAALLALIGSAGLQVLGRSDIRPRHPRAADATDPLHAARAAEVTSLWRLGVIS